MYKRQVYVIADSKERENMIREQIKAIEAEQDVQVQIEEGLLNEVLNLVEYPTAFMGSFDTKYLDVPEEVLVTSMETVSYTHLKRSHRSESQAWHFTRGLGTFWPRRIVPK